ncbi:hypothetical protein FHG87_006145 [Trinorchestia longiramus]|nr:hypothetical protein FHG87_006145 [Trinorchestia longiramus]
MKLEGVTLSCRPRQPLMNSRNNHHKFQWLTVHVAVITLHMKMKCSGIYKPNFPVSELAGPYARAVRWMKVAKFERKLNLFSGLGLHGQVLEAPINAT